MLDFFLKDIVDVGCGILKSKKAKSRVKNSTKITEIKI